MFPAKVVNFELPLSSKRNATNTTTHKW